MVKVVILFFVMTSVLKQCNSARCPMIPKSEGVITQCSLPGKSDESDLWNCNEDPVPAGTTVQQFCDRYYEPDVSVSPHESSYNFVCQKYGKWSNNNNFLKCIPDGGISEPMLTPYVIGGRNVKHRGEWPWHATIYNVKTNGKKTLSCGGSLISKRVVLTAAHCVTVDGTKDLLNTTQLHVVLGNLLREYGNDDMKFIQEINIQEIKLFKSTGIVCYNPRTYECDIALIILKSPAQITGSVRTVRFSGDEELAEEQFQNALKDGPALGTTVGFGLDESKNVSLELKVIKMPFIPQEICESTFRNVNKEVRLGWICGGYSKESASVCKGDSGGGFVFPKENATAGSRRYYVQGIVSFGPKSRDYDKDPCNKDSYKVFTKVVVFAHWIKKVVDEVDKNDSSSIISQKEPPKGSETCFPIPRRKGVDTLCTLPKHVGNEVVIEDCHKEEVPVGTIAQQSCSKYYHGVALGTIVCQPNGEWSGTIFLHCTDSSSTISRDEPKEKSESKSFLQRVPKIVVLVGGIVILLIILYCFIRYCC